MARVELAAAAAADLDALIESRSLPDDTRRRVKRSLKVLQRFPRIGPELGGRWAGFRFLLGPWRWLLVVYTYDEAEDRALIVTIQDARTSTAATVER